MKGYKIMFFLIYRFVKQYEPITPEWGAIMLLYILVLLNLTSFFILIYQFFPLPIISKTAFFTLLFFIGFFHYYIFVHDKKYKKIERSIK